MALQTCGDRKYEELDDADGFETILKLFQLFQSEPMFLLLSQLTGLELSDGSCVEEEREDSGCENANGYNRADETVEGGSSCAGLGPCCVECVRRWSHGSYTLLRDMDKTDEYFLDTSLFVAKEGRTDMIVWHHLIWQYIHQCFRLGN